MKNKFYFISKAMLISMAFVFMTSAFAAKKKAPSRMNFERKLRTHSVGIGLGQVFLYGDHADNGDNGIGVDLFYAYTVSYSFDLLINTHFSNHSKGDLETNLLGSSVNIKGRFFEFDSFSPYFLAGLGFYAPKHTRRIGTQIKESSQKVGFGYSLGLGADLRLNQNVSMGLMMAFHDPFDVGQDNDPDVSGSYLRVLLNLMYTF